MDQLSHRPDEMAGYLDFLMHRRRVESSSTLLQHFAFREDPFRVNPDARYLFPSNTHIQALTALESGFYNNRGFIAMIAPPGMGKTTLLYRFLEDTKESARSTFIFDMDADCKPRDFVGYILRDFDIKPASSSSEMHKQLSEALVKETEAGRKCVIVIDEAQNLSDEVLERVRLLTNFENSQGKLLQIILSGQPQLTDKLRKASLVQLRQRVSTVCRLDLLTPDETKDYIDYRLGQAGYEGAPLFTNDALDLIAEKGGGTPRIINNLCFNTLAMCSKLQLPQADREIVARVIESMELDSREDSAPGTKQDVDIDVETQSDPCSQTNIANWWHAASGEVRLWVPALIGMLVFAALVISRVAGFGIAQTTKTVERIIAAPDATATPASNTGDVKTDTKPIANPTTKSSADGRVSIAPAPANEGPRSVTEIAVTSAGPPKSVATSLPGRALLTVDSNPVGADIEIDGRFVGNAPSSVSIAPGSHQIYVEKRGYASWNKILTVTGGKIHLSAELEQLTSGQ